MSKYKKGEAQPDGQLTMEGFEYLQTYYVIENNEKDGEKSQSMIHIEQMSYEQLTQKALEHDAFQKAHGRHRDEIYRFRDAKFESKAA
jgi:hypothetical protein